MSELYVISVGRNAGPLILNCIESVGLQTLKPKAHIVVDDVSDDDTRLNLEKVMSINPDSNLVIKLNEERKYRLKNIYENCIDKNPEDIICLVDSDDWLMGPEVLQVVWDKYQDNPEYEYVHSRYEMSHGESGGSHPIPNDDWSPYKDQWITSHLCTFKVKAVKDIPIENFLDWDGQWFKIATDHAFILPILHKLRERDGGYTSVGFIDKPLYIHTFHGNPSKPRYGTPEADERAQLAVRCSTFIKQRGYVNA